MSHSKLAAFVSALINSSPCRKVSPAQEDSFSNHDFLSFIIATVNEILCRKFLTAAVSLVVDSLFSGVAIN